MAEIFILIRILNAQWNFWVSDSPGLEEWKVSEIQGMVEEMRAMGQNRVREAGLEVKELQGTDVVDVVIGLKGLQEELAHGQPLQTSEQDLIQRLELEKVWEQERRERREWWKQERERMKEQEQDLKDSHEKQEERELQEEQELQREQELRRLRELQRLQQSQGPWEQRLVFVWGWMQEVVFPVVWSAQLPVLLWKQAQFAIQKFVQILEIGLARVRKRRLWRRQLRERMEREEREERVRDILWQVEERVKEELRQAGERDGEALFQLLRLVQDRQLQLMEPWRRQQEQQQRQEMLRREEQELAQVLHRLRRILRQLRRMLHQLREERLRMPGQQFFQPLLLAPRLAEEVQVFNWQALDRVMSLSITQAWPALTKQEAEDIRARLGPGFGRPLTLLEVIRGNHDKFLSQSSNLDALLVFAGLFSAILSAFLIDVRKGLEEDLLLEILHQLQGIQKPFQPNLVSVWVNGLWFSSLAASLVGVLAIMLAKSLSRWTISAEQAQVIFSAPEHLPRRYKEIKQIRCHFIFEGDLSLLTTAAPTLIYVAVALFFCGLDVLLYTTQKGIGILFLVLTLITGYLFIYMGQRMHN